MKKMLKTFLYIVGCTLVFISLMKVYDGTISTQSATAFEWEKPVNVYFVDSKKAETSSCEADVLVKRTIPNAETLGPGAMEMLIRGLDDKEKQSMYSAINPNTLLQKFEVRNRVAYVDFDSNLNKDAAGSCKVIAIRSQIEKTLIRLPDIDSVVISVNGQTEGILEP